MYGFTNETVNLPAIRERIARMSNEALERHGRAAAFMASRNDRETWRVQLEEARAEWRRRFQTSGMISRDSCRDQDL